MTIFQLGLIGYPLSHSLSPKIHAAALESCGLQGDYSLFPIRPEDRQGIKDLLACVRGNEIHGLNVTIPHKQTVIEFLDELTPTAKTIGAVNTIYLRSNKLIGENTDAAGFLSDLHKFIGNRQLPIVNHKSAIVLGAGGSSRAVVYALMNDDWKVTVAARRLEQAQQLADSFSNRTIRSTQYFDLPLSTFHLLVNTTPLGMIPNTDSSPLPETVTLPNHILIYDLVYNPRDTKLVKTARNQGLKATTGLGMLIEQAALSFEIWTGSSPSREILRASVEQSPVSSP